MMTSAPEQAMRWLLIISISFVLTSCTLLDGTDDGLGGMSLAELRSAPEVIEMDGRELALRTYLWRDFMPIAPPDGHGLVGVFWIHTVDSSTLPGDLDSDAVWIVNGDDVWASYFSDEAPPPSEIGPDQLHRVVRGGPKWDPHIMVDVVVRVFGGDGKRTLLRASNQEIFRTD